MKTVEVFIEKPIYGCYVAVYDKYLKQAIHEKSDITIKTKVDGKEYQCTISPLLWIKDSKIIYKEFKIPGHPMKLYANTITNYI